VRAVIRPGDNPQPMKNRAPSGGLVYSTDAGRMCPACRRPIAQCACPKSAPAPASDGIVRVSRETKGRGGKAVTVVRGLALDAASLDKLARQLKATCGSGGTVKDGVVEVQGDHCDKVMAFLQAQGHKVKRAGG
jgi:translation initiation factor 1